MLEMPQEYGNSLFQSMNGGHVYFVGNNTNAQDGELLKSNGNQGTLREPFSTIDRAINIIALKPSGNDLILVKQGHTETITSATGLVPDIDGLHIVGLGVGEDRPTITFATSTAANIPISGDNVSISNIIFKCNIASQVAMVTTTGKHPRFHNCDFREGSATGLGLVKVGVADNDSDYAEFNNCKFYQPTAGNGDYAIQLAKDMIGVKIVDCNIDGDFDNAAIEIPSGGNAQVAMVIDNCVVKNRQSGIAAISANGTGNKGVIRNSLLITNSKSTALDAGGLVVDNVNWHNEGDQVASVPVIAAQAGSGGAVGDLVPLVVTVTSSNIPNNTQAAGGLLATVTGTMILERIILQTDSTGIAAPTNLEFSTDNAKGLTGAGAPNATVAVSALGANKTVNVFDAANEVVPIYFETGKKLYVHGDNAAGTGAGTMDVIMYFRRVSADASVA